jgi:hypothetical protein
MHLFILFLSVLPFVLSSKYGFDTLQKPTEPDLNPAPPSTTLRRPIYKQATRKSILARKEHKAKLAERNKHVERTLVERATATTTAAATASPTPYPACNASTTASYIAGTGFANLSPYYIPRVAGYNVVSLSRRIKLNPRLVIGQMPKHFSNASLSVNNKVEVSHHVLSALISRLQRSVLGFRSFHLHSEKRYSDW